MTGSSAEKEQLAEGTLISHLVELRQRLMKSVIAVVLIFLALVPFVQPIFNFVSAPLKDVLPEGSNLIVTGIPAPFLTWLKSVFQST